MSGGTNPKALRIENLEDWHSRGFYGDEQAEKLKQDFKIRNFLKKRLDREHVEKVEIERSPSTIKIIIFTSRPGLIIGRRGSRVSSLKEDIEKEIEGLEGLKIDVKAVKNVWTSAKLVAEWMASQLEQRVSYRRVMKQAMGKIMRNRDVEGARVQVSGRLNGLEMSRTEWLKEGKLKRQSFRSDLDYAHIEAYCTYGVLGIKVWVYKGEKL